MAFIQEELRNLSFKAVVAGILGTRNRSSAPDNGTYYEEIATSSMSVHPNQVMLNIGDLPEASNMTEASNAAALNPLLLEAYDGSTTAKSIHLTPAPGNKAFFATEVFGDLSTRMINFVMPQMIPKSNGFPSLGYTMRLYNGDPSAGGTEITTTIEQVGADVGWVAAYGPGAVITASSFTAITDPNDVWITAYRYIGPTLDAGVLTDTGLDDARYFEFTADQISPFNLLWLKSNIYNDESLLNVYLNGTLLAPGVDWTINNQMQNKNNFYSQHLEFPNAGTYLPSDVISIVYKENIIQNGPELFLGLYENFNLGGSVKTNTRMIPSTSNITLAGTPYDAYLSDANIISEYEADVTYTDFYDSSTTQTIKKKYPDSFKISEFKDNQDLANAYPGINITIEVWGRPKNKSIHNTASTSRSTSKQNKIICLYYTTNNSVQLNAIGSTSDLHVRLKYIDDATGELLGFSDFSDTKIRRKNIKVFTTDPSLSNKNFKGHLVSTKLI